MTMETRLRISFLLTYRLTVKLFTLFVESGLGQHAIDFFEVELRHFVQAGPIRTVRMFPLGTISYTNKQTIRRKIKKSTQDDLIFSRGGGTFLEELQNKIVVFGAGASLDGPPQND